ncbi:response regulator transcription factor [Clostridium gasigenes]|uniref:response regulator transcription factor n=1 Tax=Clostridium gasigenes TaxID=94869 RepID=UPI001C0CF70A|nr:response regulator [Clostridium gasigenes]MBU3108017.1 response regulator [Clostridium gasigenes]
MLNILVIEDEAPIREWIVYTISNLSKDFNVVASASNGKEGYELAVKLKPDVIFTDIGMPIMDGLEFTREIKKVMKDVVVILLTNFEKFSYAKRAISYGVYEYLIKSDIRPKDINELLRKVADSIEGITSEVLDEINSEERIENKGKQYSKAIKRSMDYIDDNYKNHISLGDISKYVFLSHEYFSRLFKEEVGENFSTYLTNYRMKKAEYLLKNTDKKIGEIANEVGYANTGYFSKSYKKCHNVSPEDDRY